MLKKVSDLRMMTMTKKKKKSKRYAPLINEVHRTPEQQAAWEQHFKSVLEYANATQRYNNRPYIEWVAYKTGICNVRDYKVGVYYPKQDGLPYEGVLYRVEGWADGDRWTIWRYLPKDSAPIEIGSTAASNVEGCEWVIANDLERTFKLTNVPIIEGDTSEIEC